MDGDRPRRVLTELRAFLAAEPPIASRPASAPPWPWSAEPGRKGTRRSLAVSIRQYRHAAPSLPVAYPHAPGRDGLE
jgi:hypothetical protein